MGDINRNITIYLNEADVEAALGKLQKSAAKLEEQMNKAGGDPAKHKELQAEFDKTTGKIEVLSKQLSGELNPSMRQMEGAIAKARNELKNMATGTDEFNTKAKKLSEAEAQLKKVRDEAFGVGKAINDTGKGAGVFSVIKDKVMGLAGSLPGLGEAFTALTGPIGIIAGVLVGLIGLLGQNAEVADKFSYVMGGVKKVIHTLADDLVNLIQNGFGKLVEAFKHPVETFMAVSKALGDAILHPLDAITELGKAFKDYGTHLADAAEEGYNAAEMYDHLGKKQAELQAQIARTQIIIEKQTTAMRDATKSDEERIASAKKVIELETLNSNRRLASIDLEISAYTEKQKNLKLNDEEEEKLIRLKLSRDQEVANKEAAIRKATNEAQKLEAELAAKALKENLIVDGLTPITEAVIKSNEVIKDSFEKLKEAPVAIKQVFTDYFDSLLTDLRGFWKDWGSVIGSAVSGVQGIITGSLDIVKTKQNDELANEVKNNADRHKSLDKLLKAKKISQQQYDKEIAKSDEALAAKQAEIKKKQFISDKAAKIVTTVINTAMSIVNAFATMPYPAAIAMAAIAGAVGAAQIGIIAAQPVPTFARGGVARGASHAAGGISLVNSDGRKVGEMEGGEPYMILSGNTYRNNGRIIDALLDTSMNRGGAPLDLGALPQQPRFNFGGVFENIRTAKFATGGVFSNNAQSDLQTALLGQLLDRLNTPIRSEVVYQDITDKGNALNKASYRASFSRT